MTTKNNSISKMIEEVYLLRRAFVCDDLNTAVERLSKHSLVTIKDHLFKSSTQFNGWEVPQKWEVEKAEIRHKGKVVYDGTAHPLGVITHCHSFQGTLSLKELKKHLFVAQTRPNAIPFNFRFMYRPWEKGWGFCLPKNLLNSLKDGEYEIDIKTTFSEGEMLVREFILEGEKEESIIFAAHIDHAGQANDDVAGCAVGIALLNAIKEKYPKRRYTYRLILTQEIVGSVFYLNDLSKKERSQLKYGMFLEMLGNNNTLNLQRSLQGNTYIDSVCELALTTLTDDSRVCNFRESAGNDEIVFEAPGYNIPMPSLSRWPYVEYHTSDDNMNIIFEDKLQQSVDYLLNVVNILEHDVKVKRKFSGLVSLANPKYNLYIDPGQVVNNTFGQNAKEASFQYKMPNYLEGNYRISEIATLFGLKFDWLLDYFNKMKAKGLVSFK